MLCLRESDFFFLCGFTVQYVLRLEGVILPMYDVKKVAIFTSDWLTEAMRTLLYIRGTTVVEFLTYHFTLNAI